MMEIIRRPGLRIFRSGYWPLQRIVIRHTLILYTALAEK